MEIIFLFTFLTLEVLAKITSRSPIDFSIELYIFVDFNMSLAPTEVAKAFVLGQLHLGFTILNLLKLKFLRARAT